MRIKVSTIPDFVVHLLADGSTTHLKRVYRDITYEPIQSFTNQVHFHITAVLQFKDGGEAFLEYGKYCGLDRTSKPLSTEGTDYALSLISTLQDALKNTGYAIVPGIIDMT